MVWPRGRGVADEYIVHSFEPGRLFGEFRDKSRFIIHPAAQGLRHPNEKPERVIAKLIALGSQVGETVLDFYCGSGTTLAVAKRLGRKAIGVECEERHCESTVSRLAQQTIPFDLPPTPTAQQSGRGGLFEHYDKEKQQ